MTCSTGRPCYGFTQFSKDPYKSSIIVGSLFYGYETKIDSILATQHIFLACDYFSTLLFMYLSCVLYIFLHVPLPCLHCVFCIVACIRSICSLSCIRSNCSLCVFLHISMMFFLSLVQVPQVGNHSEEVQVKTAIKLRYFHKEARKYLL